MKIVICGSMSASKQMLEIKNALEVKGHEIYIPRNTEAYASGVLSKEDNAESTQNKVSQDLIRKHYELIKNADAIVVANYKKGDIDNYIGGNTFLECGFAHVLSKKLYFINEIPEVGYADELKAMQPIILKGDLSCF